MASIEFLTKRIEGAEAKVDKLTKKMDRIKVALAGGKNPYSYNEYDFRVTNRELGDALNALEGYKVQLEKEQEKAASRNIKVIIDFLEDWKAKITESYHDAFERYLTARAEYYASDSAYVDWVNTLGWKIRRENPEEYKAREKAHREERAAFKSTWGFMFRYVEYSDTFNDELFQKDIKQEAEAKYDDIIERTNDLIGQILDASDLHIGKKGDLNGYIIGERGTVKVETIGAGGYNIQCYHFRTLIHKVK